MTPTFNLIQFDLDNVPKLERKADPPKKKERKPVEGAQAAVVDMSQGAPPVPTQNKEKKEMVENPGKKKSSGGGKAVPVDEGEPRPSMIDLRVGHIVDGKCSPKKSASFA